MKIWSAWYEAVASLRKACSRQITFGWLVVVLAMFCTRNDQAGVTSFIRAGWLKASCYPLLLHFFHSKAVNVKRLTKCWIVLAIRKFFTPTKIGGFRILVADGIKIPKEGKKMPAVKCLHNDSENNSKAEYIMGHSFQAISLLADAGHGKVVAVPLMSRISEGVVCSNRDKRTLLDKLVSMCAEIIDGLADDEPTLLVADAYYASQKVMEPLTKKGVHVITRARNNAVAYREALQPDKRGRGRPRLYGDKVRLRELFEDDNAFSVMPSPVYGETNVELCYRCIDLVWRPLQHTVRFVLVVHPTRGRMILMSTNMELAPRDIIAAYGLRFKIEVSFKQAVHTMGTYAYHFWMMAMKPIRRCSGNQYMHRESERYREAVRRKIDAYHRFVQLGCIAQGLLQHMAINFKALVWQEFRSWLRTMKPEYAPSEMVVAMALRSSLPHFLQDAPTDHILKKFIVEKADPNRLPEFLLAA